MIMQLVAENGQRISQRDLTGALWVSAHNGLVNAQPIVFRCSEKISFVGQVKVELTDLLGGVVSRGILNLHPQGHEHVMRPGDNITIMPGEFNFALSASPEAVARVLSDAAPAPARRARASIDPLRRVVAALADRMLGWARPAAGRPAE